MVDFDHSRNITEMRLSRDRILPRLTRNCAVDARTLVQRPSKSSIAGIPILARVLGIFRLVAVAVVPLSCQHSAGIGRGTEAANECATYVDHQNKCGVVRILSVMLHETSMWTE
jgi:hypothetical protein